MLPLVLQIVLFIICHVCSCFAGNKSLYYSDKTMLFVSGWPQSGTSLLQQMLTVTPGMSTMVEKCKSMHGSRCLNWNNEGQWLIERSPEITPYLQPGKMCPIEGDKLNPPLSTVLTLSKGWAQYWDLEEQILVEKSPQSMLKIKMLANTFSEAKQLKFLVVVKHPVTLNIATLPNMGWLTNTLKPKEPDTEGDKSDSNLKAYKNNAFMAELESQISLRQSAASSSSREVKAAFNTETEALQNLQHFIYFMTHNELKKSKYSGGATDLACSSLGWLPAMQVFSRQLRDLKTSHSHVAIGVVRYE